MRLRELFDNTTQAETQVAPPTGGNAGADTEAARNMIAAGRSAIQRVLSADSEGFLESTVQTGGQ